ncbi:MAG: hypothetical protein QCI82_06170 [Candidatus Thermoplasmatota archaeon]|nr:hypothetical protein [Candidatus Thermoplasmatota archaeon]
MSRHSSAIRSHSCGICGSPNCISHTLRRAGTCPFEDTDHEWNALSMNEATLDLLERGRTKPSMKEISPCSEYTRFTMEGVLEDPLLPDKNAVFDPITLGESFKASRFSSKKWSEPLSYGMAVDREDTRIHLHGKGKIIIRRAIDRDHAVSLFNEIADLMWPSLLDSTSGMTLSETIHSLSLHDMKIDTKRWGPFMDWPASNGNDMADINIVMDHYRKQRSIDIDGILKATRVAIGHGTQRSDIVTENEPSHEKGMRAVLYVIMKRWNDLEVAGYATREEALGARTHFLIAQRGISGFIDLIDEKYTNSEISDDIKRISKKVLFADDDPATVLEKMDRDLKIDRCHLRHLFKFIYFIMSDRR